MTPGMAAVKGDGRHACRPSIELVDGQPVGQLVDVSRTCRRMCATG